MAPNTHDKFLWCPDLHTATAYKMINCWPRLRLRLTLPGVTAMTYMKASDESDTSLVKPSKHSIYTRIMAHDVITSLEYFYGHLSELPFPLPELVLSSPLTSAGQVLASLSGREQQVDDDTGIELDEHSLVVLLILSVVLPLSASHDPQLAKVCFTTVMQRHWIIHAQAETNVICISLMIVTCLIHQWAKPFHALGILQSVQVYSAAHSEKSRRRCFYAICSSLRTSILYLSERPTYRDRRSCCLAIRLSTQPSDRPLRTTLQHIGGQISLA